MLRVLAAFFLVVVGANGPAQAAFGDCSDGDYLGGFGSAEAGRSPLGPIRQLNCVIEFEFSFETPGGTRQMRGIRDASADWAIGPGALADVERGARRSVEAMRLLGNYRISDVTILLLDDAYEPSDLTDDGSYVGALTSGAADDQECQVTSFLLGRAGAGDGIAYNVAHEIFHCIQRASLSPEQMATSEAGGMWWAEGSAEYFAGLALPELGDLHGRADEFNASVEANVALNDQAYGMVVFFYWFHAGSGPGRLMTFLSGMAPSSNSGAQHAAMRGSGVEWLRFAQDYSDRTIAHPSGAGLGLNPPGGEFLTFDGNVTETLTLSPFVIALGTAEYDCGRWANTITPSDVLSAQDIGGGAWFDYPDEVDARSRAEGSYRIAALPTGDEREVRIEAERRESCEPCNGSDAIDVCLVGSWTQSGGGAVEWMRAQGMPSELIIDVGPQIMVLEDDGTYWTVPFTAEMHGVFSRPRGDTTVRGSARAAAAGGRWSSESGQFAICQDAGGVTGDVTVTSRYGTGTMPIGVPGGGVLQHSYSCGETAMQSTLQFPGMAPMVTEYTRISVDEPDPVVSPDLP